MSSTRLLQGVCHARMVDENSRESFLVNMDICLDDKEVCAIP